MLSGVGVPDLRGGLGTSFFYTSAHDISAENSEKIIQVTPAANLVKTVVIGPRNPKIAQRFAF